MRQDSTHPTGVAVDQGEKENSDAVINARQRKARAAVAMKANENYSWTKIARVLGFPTARAAIVAVENSIVKDFDLSDRTALRAMFQARFEALLKPVWKIAQDPDHPLFLACHKRAQEVLDRYIKLMGVDAPQELVIYSPSERELDEWVAEQTGARTKKLPESDIFELPPDQYEVHEEAG